MAVAVEASRSDTERRELRQRLLEMLLEGIPPDTVIAKIRSSGLKTGDITADLGEMCLAIQLSNRHREASRDHAVWLAGVHRALQSEDCSVLEVDTIDASEFFGEYYRLNRPLLVHQAFPDEQKYDWTFERIKTELGSATVEIMRNRVPGQGDFVDREKHRSSVVLGEFIDEILRVETDEIYLTSHNNALSGPLGRAVSNIRPFPDIMLERLRMDASLWMGPKGVISPLHYDKTNVMLVELLGTKRITLFSPYDECFLYHEDQGLTSPVDPKAPDYDSFPLFRFATPYQVTVPEGAALFIPVAWWHYVESLSPTFSMSMSNFDAVRYFPANLF